MTGTRGLTQLADFATPPPHFLLHFLVSDRIVSCYHLVQEKEGPLGFRSFRTLKTE